MFSKAIPREILELISRGIPKAISEEHCLFFLRVYEGFPGVIN